VVIPSANAACLPGDLDPSCIGVYKAPLGTVPPKELLNQFAPDIRYIPAPKGPTSRQETLELLEAQYEAAQDISAVVARGNLEEAGIKVLNLLPKTTIAAQRLLETVPNDNSVVAGLRIQQYQTQLELALSAWNEVDVMIGQGLRGQLGVAAAAQILILKEIKEATLLLQEFMTSMQRSV